MRKRGNYIYSMEEMKAKMCRYVYGEQLKKFYSEGRNYVTRRR